MIVSFPLKNRVRSMKFILGNVFQQERRRPSDLSPTAFASLEEMGKVNYKN